MNTYTRETLPDWVAEGKNVYVLTGGTWKSRSLRLTEILRIGKRDIVVAGRRGTGMEDRFKVRDLTPSGTHYSATRLIALDDPRVEEIRAENRRQRLVIEARNAVEEWDRIARGYVTAEPTDGSDEAIKAIRALVELLPEGGVKDELLHALPPTEES